MAILALGFEDRSAAAAVSLGRSGIRAKAAILLEYNVNQTENLAHLLDVGEALDILTDRNWSRLPFETESPLRNTQAIRETIARLGKVPETIGVDVSSLSSSAIFEVFSVLSDFKGSRIVVFYTEAGSYDYPHVALEKLVDDEEYLSSGVRAIHTVPGFEGEYSPGAPPMLIIFLGFEEIRARGICERFPPSARIAILSRPSSKDGAARLELERKINRNVLRDSSREVQAPALDIEGVLLILNELYREFAPTHNLTITPLGSKMQSLAMLLFLREHRDVQLLISTPLQYHTHRYQKGVGMQHWVELG